jgi:DNA-binding NarL/FixJ family response regulator
VKNIKVLIVEDDAFSRVALSDALKHQGLVVVGAVDSAFEALEIQKKFSPQVAVCDLDLGIGPTGLDVAHALRRENSQIGIVMLTSFRDPRLANPELPPLPTGAILLNKRELRTMSTIVMQIVASVTNPIKRRSGEWSKTGNFQALSDTQIEIMLAVADGVTTSEIAKQRGVSEQAIEKTIRRICKNLDIETSSDKHQRVQLVRAYFYGAGRDT